MVTTKQRWTKADEAKLQHLQTKKRATYDFHVSALDDFAKAEWNSADVPRLLFTSHLMEFCKEYRDLLAPFDDGERPPVMGRPS